MCATQRNARERWKKRSNSFGRLDILFNNAGVFFANTLLDCTEEEWDLTVDICLKGTFLMSKYSLPAMIAQGSGSDHQQRFGLGPRRG